MKLDIGHAGEMLTPEDPCDGDLGRDDSGPGQPGIFLGAADHGAEHGETDRLAAGTPGGQPEPAALAFEPKVRVHDGFDHGKTGRDLFFVSFGGDPIGDILDLARS